MNTTLNDCLTYFRQALLLNIDIIFRFTIYVTYITLRHLIVIYSWKGGEANG